MRIKIGERSKKNERLGRSRKKTVLSKKEEKYMPHILRGMNDILPEDQIYWDFVLDKLETIARSYGFSRITLPILEEKKLFERGVGAATDIVEKQMFTFTDKSGTPVVLRPEGTSSVVRAYIEHGMYNLPQPVKLYYFGPMFRYERPQTGRQREFWQFGVEVLGSKEPIVDAEIILFVQDVFQILGLKISLEINSIGCETCRKIYKKKLIDYLKNKKDKFCSDCQRRFEINPLRILDCKEQTCQFFINQSPQIIDWLCEDCRNHFTHLLEYLDNIGVVYSLNPRIVRGLDYYTKTVFEILAKREEGRSGQMALGGGGPVSYTHLTLPTNREV